MLSYNYVVFNQIEGKLQFNEDGYYTICLRDLDKFPDIRPVYFPLQHKNVLLRLLYNIHNSRKVNKILKLPFKHIWWPYMFDDKFQNEHPLCFVFIERMPIEYIKYLKKRYPRSKAILIYRDLRFVTETLFPKHPDNPVFDFQFTIDAREAKKYNWIHFEEFESKPEVKTDPAYPESDVFFAGKAKDRLERLLKAYDIFTKAGLKVKYYLTGVPNESQIELSGVIYADKFMSYSEMLYHTVNTRCVLEINQKEAVGYTSRFLESVMFNKRLITDNQDVTKSKFYNPDYIQCIDKVENIDPKFIINENPIDYKYNGEFSPIHLIEKIDEILTNGNNK